MTEGSSSSSPSWRGRLSLAPGLVVYMGAGGAAEEHAHHAVQLVWVIDGKAEMIVAGRRHLLGAALIPAGVTHSFDARGQLVVLILVDAVGTRGIELDRCAHSLLGQEIRSRFAQHSIAPPADVPADAIEIWVRGVLASLGVQSCDVQAPSRATRRAIAYIEGALDRVPRITEAAAHASISASRLSHRFTQEIGLPFRRFVLWTRIKRAVEVSKRGGDLTEAALAAGFSDAAHMSRTFREMFGLSPSFVLPFVELTGNPWAKTSPLSRSLASKLTE